MGVADEQRECVSVFWHLEWPADRVRDRRLFRQAPVQAATSTEGF